MYANLRFKSVAVSVLIFASPVSMAAARHFGLCSAFETLPLYHSSVLSVRGTVLPDLIIEEKARYGEKWLTS